jgi:Zn-finger in ubiquitin-hydrolases and other protein
MAAVFSVQWFGGAHDTRAGTLRTRGAPLPPGRSVAPGVGVALGLGCRVGSVIPRVRRFCHNGSGRWASGMTSGDRSDGNGGPMEDSLNPGISLAALPSGTGCLECLSGDGPGWWLHLRRCAECGHIGCCDSSPSQHASAHARSKGHPVMRSFEPGEDWFYDHTTKKFLRGPRLPDPQSRPPEQPAPAPADKVPADWREHLHR